VAFVTALPMSGTGKVLKSKLRETWSNGRSQKVA
jgi:acyl-CoA synthetase (AMP-forming)/AMP-acid ligase II